jgi:phage terminase large subunit-like protein
MSSLPLLSLPPEHLSALLTAAQSTLAQRQAENRLKYYRPYKKQAEFHNAGAEYRERLFLCANRFGKSEAGAAETAIHLTGRYPPWWEGKRFDKPVRAWVAGVTGESTRDIVQAKLLGPPALEEQRGTGYIPKDAIGLVSPARGIPHAIDLVSVKHASGGYSQLGFKSYEKGRAKFQGAALELIWLDEECPIEIYTECLTRTNETGGVIFATMTPLMGMTEFLEHFLMSDGSKFEGFRAGT